MAMSLKEVSNVFNAINWNHKLDEEDDVIISMGGNSTSDLVFFTRMREDGEMFDMAARMLDENRDQISAKGSPYVKQLMSYLLLRNYQTKFGTWEFKEEDGTISFAVEIPLEDNNLTANQLKRITRLMNSAGEEADSIKYILEHGSLPLEADEAAQKIAELEKQLEILQGGI